MGHAWKFAVLSVVLSLVAAWENYDFDFAVLEHMHHYDYKSDTKLQAINTDAVAKFNVDGEALKTGILKLVAADNQVEDGNCGGQLGVKYPGNDEEDYCLRSFEIYIDEEKWPKTASMVLVFAGPQYLIELSVPLFRENKMGLEREKYNSKVIRSEPVTTDILREVRIGHNVVQFGASWLKEVLEKPLTGMPAIRIMDAFVSYPVVMPADKFNEMMQFLEDSQKWMWNKK